MDPDSSLEAPATGQVILDPERLQPIAERNRQDYSRADPFPHIVLDGLFSKEAIERVRQEVPRPDEIRWIEFDDARGKKLASKAETQLGAATRNFLLLSISRGKSGAARSCEARCRSARLCAACSSA